MAIATTIAQRIVWHRNKNAQEERIWRIAHLLIFVTQQKSFALSTVARMNSGALAQLIKVDLIFVCPLRMEEIARLIAQLNVAKMRNGVLEEWTIWVVKGQNYVLQLIVS